MKCLEHYTTEFEFYAKKTRETIEGFLEGMESDQISRNWIRPQTRGRATVKPW